MAKVKPTPKQAEILSRLKKGKHPQTIAAELGYSSVNSVYNHMRRMRQAGITVPDKYERGNRNGRPDDGPVVAVSDDPMEEALAKARDNYEAELADVRDAADVAVGRLEREVNETQEALNGVTADLTAARDARDRATAELERIASAP